MNARQRENVLNVLARRYSTKPAARRPEAEASNACDARQRSRAEGSHRGLAAATAASRRVCAGALRLQAAPPVQLAAPCTKGVQGRSSASAAGLGSLQRLAGSSRVQGRPRRAGGQEAPHQRSLLRKRGMARRRSCKLLLRGRLTALRRHPLVLRSAAGRQGVRRASRGQRTVGLPAAMPCSGKAGGFQKVWAASHLPRVRWCLQPWSGFPGARRMGLRGAGDPLQARRASGLPAVRCSAAC